MRYALDTSVVLRLLIGEPADHLVSAVAFLDEAGRQGSKPAVSDLVIAESYFALQFHYGISKKDALGALHALLEGGEILALGQAGKVLSESNPSKPGFVDRLIHAAYVAEGCQMVTFEKAAGKLDDVVVLKPAKA